MSKLAVHIQHYKKSAVGSLARHNWEKRGARDSHSNQDIDPSRSKDNIALVLPERSLYREVKSMVEQSTGRVTSSSVWVSEWIIYPPEELQDPFVSNKEELQRYFSDVLEWMKKEFKVKMAVVHMDETTVHMHVDTVPITKDGKLSRKAVYTRAALNNIHTKLADHLSKRGWDIQRGESTEGKQVRSQTVPEYKKQAEEQKIQLVGEIQDLRKEAQEVNDWLNSIPGWPEYEEEANNVWNVIESFKKFMQDVFNSGWIFRNRKGELGLIRAVENVSGYIRDAISRLRRFETAHQVPEDHQRSKVISESLDDMLKTAETKKELQANQQKQIKVKDDYEH